MESFISFISQPWPWYVGGPLIGLMILLLLWIENKPFAVAGSYRHLCAATVPAGIPFLKYNWKAEAWNLFFAAGIIAGGIFASAVLLHPDHIAISEATTKCLQDLGLHDTSGFLPRELFSFTALGTIKGLTIMVAGGFLVGFGSRYAGGCTSGHSMSGISDLQWTSMLATAFFFAGGILSSYILLPLILKLFP